MLTVGILPATVPQHMKMSNKLTNMDDVVELAARGALFIVNHSGGKDSQAMYALIREFVPAAQLAIVHADLGRVEWSGVKEHIRATTDGLPLEVALPTDRAGNTKDLLQVVRDRHQKLESKRQETGKRINPWPSPSQRWCTSDFKRGPIEREIRRIMAERGFTLAVNCLGLRADESDKRECGLNKEAFKATGEAITLAQNESLSKAGRQVYQWLPIHKLTTDEVFQVIADAGQKPHPVYALGMTRLSCSFCIMASKADLKTAAKLRPDLAAEYAAIEKETGYTMQGKPLTEILG